MWGADLAWSERADGVFMLQCDLRVSLGTCEIAYRTHHILPISVVTQLVKELKLRSRSTAAAALYVQEVLLRPATIQ